MDGGTTPRREGCIARSLRTLMICVIRLREIAGYSQRYQFPGRYQTPSRRRQEGGGEGGREGERPEYKTGARDIDHVFRVSLLEIVTSPLRSHARTQLSRIAKRITRIL